MTTETAASVRNEVRGEARHGDRVGVFWRYWSASTVSQLGDEVTRVALPLVAVVALHATALQVALITGAGYLAWLLIGLPAGVLVHRLPLRGTQVAMDLIRGAAVASVPLAAALGVLGLPQLVVVALLVGLASVVFDVGNATFLPSIVAKEELTVRNSLMSGSAATTQLAGPSLGGVLVQFLGGAASMLLDAVSYLLSAALLRTLPAAKQPPAERAPAGGVREQIREGWRFVTQHPVIGPCVAVATAVNFVCGGLMTLTPVFLVRTLGAPAAAVGALMATGGLGSLLGAAATPRLVARTGSGGALRRAALTATAFAFLLPAAGPGWGTLLFAFGNAGFSAGVVVTSIVTRTHRQTHTPPELLPRVMATVRFVSWGAIPVGALAAGAASAVWGTRTALVLLAVSSVASPSILLASRIRRMRELA
ncbi:MFS transporter [Kitasatospora aureofaciens]|uniref:MFS transporter n=1 Tax=Kitasatospora aureofaciens TaxID=1894 RepID=UPI001C43A7D5|nr:MFS transporter [Kitasatospora aureofaciens]MBV6700345.1 MFS transporter [Kitasatospora aureofaciens]